MRISKLNPIVPSESRIPPTSPRLCMVDANYFPAYLPLKTSPRTCYKTTYHSPIHQGNLSVTQIGLYSTSSKQTTMYCRQPQEQSCSTTRQLSTEMPHPYQLKSSGILEVLVIGHRAYRSSILSRLSLWSSRWSLRTMSVLQALRWHHFRVKTTKHSWWLARPRTCESALGPSLQAFCMSTVFTTTAKSLNSFTKRRWSNRQLRYYLSRVDYWLALVPIYESTILA